MFIKNSHIDCLINVVEITQWHRQLYLTTQLLELGLPMVVVLSKADRKEAPTLDTDVLSNNLGCPVFTLDTRQIKSKGRVVQAIKVLPSAYLHVFRILNVVGNNNIKSES